MADHYIKFSYVLRLPTAAAAYATALHQRAAEWDREGGENPATAAEYLTPFPEDLKEFVGDDGSGWDFEMEDQSVPSESRLWFSGDGLNAALAFTRHLLAKFDPQGYVAVEWSHDCSKPRTDAYGGGAALVTAQRLTYHSTGDWLAKQTKRPLIKRFHQANVRD